MKRWIWLVGMVSAWLIIPWINLVAAGGPNADEAWILLKQASALPPILDVQADGDTLTICLDIAPNVLRSEENVEHIEANVARTLIPLDWRVLHVKAQDPEDGLCKPLSDFLAAPELAWLNGSQAKHITPATSPLAETFPDSLAGKTVYVSAGHGWEWRGGPNWRTQRPPYQEIIEDHNNAEAVGQYLIPYLENAGATVIPVRERDWNATRVIADNDERSAYVDVGEWHTSAQPGHAEGTYRFVQTVTRTATATATWTLTVSQRGEYALYAWINSEPNRAPDAHYAIHHAAGQSELTLDQRIRPATWRYLGTFPVYAGPLTVTLDNLSADAGAYVVADALRLGGGVFDDLTGIETTAPSPPDTPWWETCTFYYSQWMGMAQPYGDVTARPIYARWQHAGVDEDAVYISWHTNGYNGDNDIVSGTVSYVHNASTYPRTEGSLALQNAVHTELVEDIRAGWEPGWRDLGQRARNLGEVRELWDEDPTNRMPGVLLEIGYHDNAHDANALKEPRFNQLAARAVYQGILHYFEEEDSVDLVEVPEPPTHLRVENAGDGALRVTWRPPTTDTLGLYGDPATGYRVYTSPDGFAWRDPVTVTGNSVTLTGFASREPVYVRVTATNSGGESFPTEILGARVGGAPALLIVNGFDKLSRFDLVEEIDPVEQYNLRMWLAQINGQGYTVHHGESVPDTYAWDSASNEAVALGLVDLEAYPMVDWILGEESTEVDGTLNATEQTALRNFVQDGGALLISGSELLWDLVDQERGIPFASDILHAGYAADDAGSSQVTPTDNGAFEGLSSFSFNASGEYDADAPDVLTPLEGAQAVLFYGGLPGHAAAVQHDAGGELGPEMRILSPSDGRHYERLSTAEGWAIGQSGRTLVLGFPFEVIQSASRDAVLSRSLAFLDGDVATVQVQLEREKEPSFWDGVGWSPSATWLTATGTVNWHFALPCLDGGHYVLRARGVDTYGTATPAETHFTIAENAIYLPLTMRASSLPDTCENILEDGFEHSNGWEYGTLAKRVTDIVHSGAWAARVGIPPNDPGGGETSYSSISISLTVPMEANKVTLTYWAYPIAEANDPDDYQYVGLRDADHTWYPLSTDRDDHRTWQVNTEDLSAFAGQTITLYLGTKNDGDEDTAALYVDDVAVEVCR